MVSGMFWRYLECVLGFLGGVWGVFGVSGGCLGCYGFFQDVWDVWRAIWDVLEAFRVYLGCFGGS